MTGARRDLSDEGRQWAEGPAKIRSMLSHARSDRARHTRVPHHNHMAVPWHEVLDDGDIPATQASLADKSSVICRAGLLTLSGGTESWRVRDCMNKIAEVLGVTCTAAVSLTTVECTCFDGQGSFSEIVSLPSTGVNTERIWRMERFTRTVQRYGRTYSVNEFHRQMDQVEHAKGNYAPWQVGLASAAACAAFVFLLGGGPIEMGCAFVGAGLGNFVRRLMGDRHLTNLACVGVSVAVACLAYLGCLSALSLVVPGAMGHEAGYIGAMLFVIPGFPLIASGLDIAKLDLRSGIERLVYAGSIIVSATIVAWLVATTVQLYPDEFSPLGLSDEVMLALRLVASFVGVLGFSMMFNSPWKMAATAGVVGAVANTLRLTLVDEVAMAPEAAALTGAVVAGLLATVASLRVGFPRITITVPSIVIMVPGLYMYRAVYFMGVYEVTDAISWAIRAVMIVLCLPMGLGIARALTDPEWRYCN